jgi:hypothetical protein
MNELEYSMTLKKRFCSENVWTLPTQVAINDAFSKKPAIAGKESLCSATLSTVPATRGKCMGGQFPG